MATINLRNFYPEENLDCFIEVPDGDVEAFTASLTKVTADIFFAEQRKENAYQRRVYQNKSHYSLNKSDGIENDALTKTSDPFELLAKKQSKENLFIAIESLPQKMRRRIYAYYFFGMSKAEIARSEGVNKSQVTRSIQSALEKIKKIFLN